MSKHLPYLAPVVKRCKRDVVNDPSSNLSETSSQPACGHEVKGALLEARNIGVGLAKAVSILLNACECPLLLMR